jgi:hypothetical protein
MSEQESFLQRARYYADSIVGVAIGLLVLVVGLASGPVRNSGREVLITSSALSMGALTTVLAALAIMVVFLGEEFVAVLEQTDDGVGGAFRPFVLAAIVSAASTLVGLLGALVYPAAQSHFQAVLLALSAGGLGASVTAIVLLVDDTAFFGRKRFTLLAGMREAVKTRDRRLRDSA